MNGQGPRRFVLAHRVRRRGALFGFVAIIGILLGGWMAPSPAPPAAAITAAQLLPPGTVVSEIPLDGGGFLRARSIEDTPRGIVVGWDGGRRELPGLSASGPRRQRVMWLGSDAQGRDVASRLFHGGVVGLLVSSIACFVAIVLGTVLGIAASILPRPLSGTIRTLTDGGLSVPRILWILVLGLMLQGSVLGVGLAIGLTSWMSVARLVSGSSDSIAASEVGMASRASGAGRMRQIGRWILPLVAPQVLVLLPMLVAEALLLESTLAFLGVGASADVHSWGRMIADGQHVFPRGWWVVVVPGILLTGLIQAAWRLSDTGTLGAPAEKNFRC